MIPRTGPVNAVQPALARRELVVSSGVAGLVALALVVGVPRGGDAAAHLYRTLLVERGALVWDNLWFAGQYPLSSYSLLYYLLAAPIGNVTIGVIAVVLAAVLFTSILIREWGLVARWPARWFALLAGGQFFTGDYPYTAGFAMLLATLWLLQRGYVWLAVAAAALTLGFSPLAFLLLCLALAALFLRTRRLDARALIVGGSVAGLAGLQLAVLSLLPSRGLYYPYGLWRLAAGLAVAGLGAALAWRGRGRVTLTSLFVVWAAANVGAFLVPSPVGHNLLRPGAIIFPIMLLTALLADFRPRWLAAAALTAALAANVVPYLSMIPVRSTEPAGRAAFWQPLLGFLKAHSSPDYRIEVVPTANHWETYFLPRAGYALARGWYRQLDIGVNPSLYEARLTPARYRAWLRSVGVRYVILPRTSLGPWEAAAEARLLRSGASGLRRVFTASAGEVYELPQARPLLTGPGEATVAVLTHSQIEGRVSRAGPYTLLVHYTPYLRVTRGPVCVRRGPNGMTEVVASGGGSFSLRALEQPGDVLAALLGGGGRGGCGGAPLKASG